MKLSEAKIKNSSISKIWGFIVLLLLLALFIVFLSSEKTTKNLGPIEVGKSFLVESDLESTFDSLHFIQDQISGVSLRTNEEAHSGKYSVILDGQNQYSLNITIDDPKPHQRFMASVWIKIDSGKNPSLIASAEDSKLFYQSTNIRIKADKNGWGKLELPIILPAHPIHKLKVYVFRPARHPPAYFDDIKLEKVIRDEKPVLSDIGEEIHMKIENKAQSRLKSVIVRAQNAGTLIVEDDDWVKGTLENKENDIEVKLRYKGDWLDHLSDQKKSYRIKVKEPNHWKGMITFSLQSPHTRLFLHEWFYHQFLNAEGVLTPRYDFVDFKLNNQHLGVYAFEEHFDKQIIEHSNRREGPILKFSEELIWEGRYNARHIMSDWKNSRTEVDNFWRADVRAFKEGRTFATEGLKKSFELAQNLLVGWKYGELTASDVFEVELLAKYYAITDVCQAYHSTNWHNQRFYYNPVLAKIEPIGYDGFGEGPIQLGRGPFLGYFNGGDGEENFYDRLFLDADFVRYYNAYLAKYTDENFLNNLMTNLAPQIDERMKKINVEFPNYSFIPEDIVYRGKNIQIYLPPGRDGTLLARSNTSGQTLRQINCINRHYLGLDIVGYSLKRDGRVFDLEDRIFMPPRNSRTYGDPIEFEVSKNAKFIVYQVAGISKKYYAEIIAADFAKNVFPRKELEDMATSAPFDFIQRDSGSHYIASGKYIIDRDLVLPKGQRLIIDQGVTIDVRNQAKIIINGPVISKGTADNPVRFTSSDKSAQGFTVLQSKEKSFLRHTHFDQFNTLKYKGWVLTGAVTFYESDLTMIDCSVRNNLCEDALNTIRCDVTIDGLLIADTYSDGFDADFCTGTIDNTTCLRTGNDGFDFSGSDLKVKACTIRSAGDKGISVGEHAEIEIIKAEISSANIGVASKDLSVLNIHHVALKDCNQGFAVYQKKPEFGPATMKVRNYTMDDVSQPYLVDRGSELVLKGKRIKGE